MNKAVLDKLAAAKNAIITGDPAKALRLIDEFFALISRVGISSEERPLIDARVAELRSLAEASMRGARQAFDEMQAIVLAARSLQTYDQDGCRHVASTAAPPPHRF